jgi:8-oxo-dGTP diphosphatase
MVQVVAAILERDGKILIGQRKPGQSHALKWEFPGGKIEAGETPEQALARELKEELDLDGVQGAEITRYPYQYPGKSPIELIFLRVTASSGQPRNLIYHEVRWEPAEALASFDFLEGDADFIRALAK